MSKVEILVDWDEFFERFADDVKSANEEILVRVLTFEGDSTGWSVAKLLLSALSRKIDVSVLVDEYTLWVLSDRVILKPSNFVKLREERKSTLKMFEDLENAGAKVKVSNPVCRFNIFRSATWRNHKKTICIDRKIAYVGGLNFSDHNRTWHDVMVRIEDRKFAEFISFDFFNDFSGRPKFSTFESEWISCISLDGKDNFKKLRPLFEQIEKAREIMVECPYVSYPFTDAFFGKKVKLITPLDNNRRWVRSYIFWEACRGNFDVFLFPRMLHTKAMMIDKRDVVLGSSNFDIMTLFQLEVLLFLKGRFADEFFEKVFVRDLERSMRVEPCFFDDGTGKFWKLFFKGLFRLVP